VKKKRHAVQAAFLALVLGGVFLVGAHCERWCPFGGVEAIYTYAAEGNMLCSLSTSNFFILGGVLAMTLLVRRAFCSHMCPLGTISEWLHGMGRRLRLPQYQVSGNVDRFLSLGKYILLVVVLVLTWRASELIFRQFDPCYALISRHGEDITFWAYVVAGVIIVASLFTTIPFCRWFCPLAAVLNPFSRLGVARVTRDEASCVDCGLCTKKCPTAIPVDRLVEVKASRCLSCLNCVDACTGKRNAPNALRWGPPRRLAPRWSQAALIAVVLLCTSVAVSASYLFPMPSFVKSHGTRPAETSTLHLQVSDLTCRGRANLFFYFLERDDLYEIPGYFLVEAWPDPNLAAVDITYDPTLADEDLIRQAIVEPYYDVAADFWRHSPFGIEGYDPLMLDGDLLSEPSP